MNGGELIVLFAIIMSVAFLSFCVGKVIGPARCETGTHRYEARYDELPNPAPIKITAGAMSAEELRAMLYYDVYVRDVCVRCGKTIEREPKA